MAECLLTGEWPVLVEEYEEEQEKVSGKIDWRGIARFGSGGRRGRETGMRQRLDCTAGVRGRGIVLSEKRCFFWHEWRRHK